MSPDDGSLDTPTQQTGKEPYPVDGHAGAFFNFTSNVDAHAFDWFLASEIRECHGNTELYQCSRTRACCGVWRAPLDFHFNVDRGTMLAPTFAAGDAGDGSLGPCVSQPTQADTDCDEEAIPKVGQVRNSNRTTMLRHMPFHATDEVPIADGFTSNHPRCVHCKGPARPAILMFGDMDWQDVEPQEDRWDAWKKAIAEEAKQATSRGQTLHVAILEIGAGGNVTTVRRISESCLGNFLSEGADARLIRVNPELPLGDGENYKQPDGTEADRVVSIMDKGLESIKRINKAMMDMEPDAAGGVSLQTR